MCIIYMKKEVEDKNKVIYLYGPVNNLTGKILIRKNLDPDKDLPEIICEIQNFDNSRHLYRRLMAKTSVMFMKNVYPEDEELYPSY